MGTRWSRTLFLSILVGLLSGLAARALESLADLGFPRWIGRIASTTAPRVAIGKRAAAGKSTEGGISPRGCVGFCKTAKLHGFAGTSHHQQWGRLAITFPRTEVVETSAVIENQ